MLKYAALLAIILVSALWTMGSFLMGDLTHFTVAFWICVISVAITIISWLWDARLLGN